MSPPLRPVGLPSAKSAASPKPLRQPWWPDPTAVPACTATYADLPRLIAEGFGDVPLIELKFRCAGCGSRAVFWVISGARHAGY